jgi:hypothetical protein
MTEQQQLEYWCKFLKEVFLSKEMVTYINPLVYESFKKDMNIVIKEVTWKIVNETTKK